MSKKVLILSVMWVLIAGAFSGVSAVSKYLSDFNATYGTAGTALGDCTVCHSGVPQLNPYGQAFKNAGHSFSAIESQDSDGDGFSNITEIDARTFPGDANSKPAPPQDTTPPSVGSFSVPATSSSLTVPITSFTASDNVAVTGYLVTESATPPAASDTRWNATPPTTFTVSAQGTKTLYAWARDAAGNVSAGLSATVTVTLATTDTTPPTVPAGLTAAAASNAVTLSWGASVDNVGVSDYLVFRNGIQIGTTATTSFTDASVSPATTYHYTVRARDAAGNVSADTNVVTVTTPSTNVMASPGGQQAFPRIFTASPVLSTDAAQAEPLGIGAVADGGDVLDIQIGTNAFSGPVDLYVAIQAQTIDPNNIYVLKSDNTFQPLSAGLEPWRSNVTGSVSQSLFGAIPKSALPQGVYTLFFAVTPANSQLSFYLWHTSFSIGVPIITPLSGAEEVPPVSTSGTGTAYLGVDPGTGELSGAVAFSGLTSNATVAHIHQGAVGAIGDPIIPLEGGAGGTGGVWTVPAGTVLTAAQISALAANGLYVNIHSANFPGGEIRGQIINPVVTITTALEGSQSVPPVTTPANGTSTLQVNVDTGEISGTLAFSGLLGNATGGHIHQGAPGIVGPIVVDLEGGDGATAETYTIPFGTLLTAEELNALAADELYIMVHTIGNPDGEIRGQVLYPEGAPTP